MHSSTRRTAFNTALRGRGLLARVLAGILLVLQVFVVGAVPVLDAGEDHSGTVILHVEDAQQSDCPVSHGAGDCQFCQAISLLRALPMGAVATSQPTGLRAEALPMSVLEGAPALVFLSGNTSRAPPRA